LQARQRSRLADDLVRWETAGGAAAARGEKALGRERRQAPAPRRMRRAQTSFEPDFSGFSLLDTGGWCQYKTPTFRQAVSFSNPDQDASKRLDPKKFKRCL